MMRKFLLKVSIFAAYALFIQIIFPIWADPFNVFHADNIRDNGIYPNKNYVRMKYILKKPSKFDSFLFGSSRVGVIHNDKIPGEKCYNMSYATGLPGWHLLNIKTFLENGIKPRKIYIGIDSLSYTTDYNHQIDDPMRCPYEYLTGNVTQFLKLYIDPAMILRSLPAILNGLMGGSERVDPDIFYKIWLGNPP